MKNLSLILVFQLICVFALAQSITPEVVSSGGGDTTNSNVGLSWTIGEPMVETVSSTNTKITQGFHQSHFEVISVEEHRELGFEIMVYPNPTADVIQVEINFIGKLPTPSQTEFKLVLTDNAGKSLMTKTVKNTVQHTISMQGYAKGQYLLQIKGADGELYKSAQIIKLI